MRPDEEKKALFTGSTLTLAGNNVSTATRATLARPALGAAPVSPCGAGGAGAGAGGEDMDRVSSGAESAESVRERRNGSRGVQIPEQRAIPAWTGAGPKGAVLIATSRADSGTDATGDAQGRIDFKGFRARVEGAKEVTGKEQERRSAAPAADAVAVEARTPPAMERNLFLSALANGRIEHHRNDVIITLKRVVAGGLAGMVAKSVVAPVDRVKILFQVTNEKFSFKKAEKLFQDILALEGPAGLWKGNSATMIRVFPYAGTQFMMFDSLKRWALLRKTRRDPNAEQRLSNMESLMSGSFAGATSALVTYPLDLARARLAVGHARKIGGRRRTMGVPELLRTVVRQDGFQALYRGVTPSLLGIIPYAGIAFSINEQAKHKVVVLTGKEPGTFHKLGIGALAGLIAQSCTYPLEVTRRRMQTHGLVDTYGGVKKVFEVPKAGVPKEPELMYRLNIFQTFKAVFTEQGMAGLFKGLSMNWVKGPVGISISFTTFDFLKRQFGIS